MTEAHLKSKKKKKKYSRRVSKVKGNRSLTEEQWKNTIRARGIQIQNKRYPGA